MLNLPCTKIKFTHLVHWNPTNSAVHGIYSHEDRQTYRHNLNTTHLLHILCAKAYKTSFKSTWNKKSLSKWHFVQRIDSSLFMRTKQVLVLSHNSTLPSNICVSTKSTHLLIRILHYVKIILIYIT
jgi:hypothetical protein